MDTVKTVHIKSRYRNYIYKCIASGVLGVFGMITYNRSIVGGTIFWGLIPFVWLYDINRGSTNSDEDNGNVSSEVIGELDLDLDEHQADIDEFEKI